MHFHVFGSLHHVHNKNSGLPLYVLQAPCMIESEFKSPLSKLLKTKLKIVRDSLTHRTGLHGDPHTIKNVGIRGEVEVLHDNSIGTFNYKVLLLLTYISDSLWKPAT